MDDDSRKLYDEWTRKTIAEELTPQGDLLPPWLRHPEIPSMSIGWRMGYGESYMMAWDEWVSQMEQESLVQYFKKYLPIPHNWLHWVANRCGHSVTTDMFSGKGEFKGIRWLEGQGLANFSEFKNWYDNNWNMPKSA